MSADTKAAIRHLLLAISVKKPRLRKAMARR